jgi:hypothetical protein
MGFSPLHTGFSPPNAENRPLRAAHHPPRVEITRKSPQRACGSI